MPIDEQKLRDILAEHDKDFKRQVNELQGDFKRHIGVLVEEADRKFDIVQEGYQGLADKIDVELAAIRKEIEEMRMHLFRKADLERLEALEKRVDNIEKRILRR